jgi:hypothetical protein
VVTLAGSRIRQQRHTSRLSSVFRDCQCYQYNQYKVDFWGRAGPVFNGEPFRSAVLVMERVRPGSVD